LTPKRKFPKAATINLYAMINRIIEWSLRNRFLVFCGVALLIGFGVRAVYRTPVDAIPDLSENQVVVFADWPGRSPQEVEDQVTYPLSVNLQGLAGVKTVRANSMFGFSLVTIIFDDKIDNYFARSRVLERLNYLGDVLPAGVEAEARPGCDRPRLGLSVLSRRGPKARAGRRLRPRPVARDPGLVCALPTQRRSRRGGSRERRRFCAAISD
jgi:hypothetical protein